MIGEMSHDSSTEGKEGKSNPSGNDSSHVLDLSYCDQLRLDYSILCMQKCVY